MSFIQARSITVGDAISGTIDELGNIKRQIGVYFGLFAALSAFQFGFESVFAGSEALFSILMFVLYFFGQYRLYQELLGQHGLLGDNSTRIFSFIGMALVIGAALGFASNFFLIPAIILGAKWIMAPTYLVVNSKRGIFAAMGDSWNTSNGSTLALSLAYFIFWIAWFLLIGLVGVSQETLGLSSQNVPLVQLAMHVLPISLLGLSVSAYRQLNDTEETLTSVFE